MKKLLFLLIFAVSVLSASADRDVKFYMNSGEVKCIAQERIDSIFFDDKEENLYLAFEGGMEQLVIDDIDSIKYGILPQMVEVAYWGNTATVVNPFAFDSVAVSINGAKVVVTSLTMKEVDYCLQATMVVSRFMVRESITFISTECRLPMAVVLP